ncbi:MAG: ABC transporter substrate-binding protein, partial [Chloroflexi bacterium]|nr:ABC transporter substrate-binding protein [Chloroflexota bacterium]
MKKTRLLTSAALAGALAAGGLLPLGPHKGAQADQRTSGPTRGGTVIDGLYEEPDKLIPNTSTETFGRMVQKTIFSPLFYTDDKGVLHAGLASEIPTVGNGGISNGGKTYTFHLRPGLVWSDGKPLDARDVDYSWRTWMNKDLIVAGTIGFDQIQSASVSSDKLSITFHLKGPYAPFIGAWTDDVYPMPAHIFKEFSAKGLNTSPFTFKPTVSSG